MMSKSTNCFTGPTLNYYLTLKRASMCRAIIDMLNNEWSMFRILKCNLNICHHPVGLL